MSLRDWADMDDNRIGPILMELAIALEETEDTETMRRVANRLKFMSSSIHSMRQRKEKK